MKILKIKLETCLLFLVMGLFGCGQNENQNSELVFHKYTQLRKEKPDVDGETAKVWTIKKTDVIRINLVEMAGDLSLHKHPDAEHSLMLLEGSVKAFVGDTTIIMEENDFISIPKGVPHKYTTITPKALLVSMDAPYYDPKMTIRLE